MTSNGPPPARRSTLLLGALLLLAALAFVTGLGEAPIERAEIYFLDAGRAMVERGDWLVPYYRGEPFYDKPPLTYWLIAASFDRFGPSLFAGRLVAALLALLTLGAAFAVARRLLPAEGREAAAFYATAILATSYAFVSFARLTMSDMALTLFTLTAGFAYLAAEAEGRPVWLAVCGALLGLGFLTKGPIAWVYFFALLAAVILVERRLPRIFNGWGLLGTLLAVGIGLSWFVLVYLREGSEPLEWFFLRENLQRFAASTYDADEPFWFYGFVYAVEGLPWSLLAVPALVHTFGPRGSRLLRVVAVWAALMLVPLSLSRGKIDYYLLPVMPPLALVIGAYLGAGAPSTRTMRLFSLVSAALLIGALFFPMLPAPFAPGAESLRVFHTALLVAAVLCVVAAIRPRVTAVVSVVSASVLGAALYLFGAIVPAYRSAQPTEAFLDHIARERVFAPDLKVAVCDDSLRLQRDILFTLRAPVMEECQLWALASSSRKYLLIVTAAQEKSLRSSPAIRHIATLDHLPADVTRIGTLLRGAQVSPVGLLANFATADPVARWKRNREFKRWLDTPEGQKWNEDRLVREEERDRALRKAGLK